MAKDPTGFTPAAITAQAALETVRQKEDKERALREKLLNQSRAVRFVTQDGLVLGLRKQAEKFRDDLLIEMESLPPGSEALALMFERYKTHNIYVKMFSDTETQGREAGKQLKAQKG